MKVHAYRVRGGEGQVAEAVAAHADVEIEVELRDPAGQTLRFEAEARHLEDWCAEHGLDYEHRAVEVAVDRPPTRDVVVRCALRCLCDRASFRGGEDYRDGLLDLAAALIAAQTGGQASGIRATLLAGLEADDTLDTLYDRVVRAG